MSEDQLGDDQRLWLGRPVSEPFIPLLDVEARWPEDHDDLDYTAVEAAIHLASELKHFQQQIPALAIAFLDTASSTVYSRAEKDGLKTQLLAAYLQTLAQLQRHVELHIKDIARYGVESARLTRRQISEDIGVHQATVGRWLKEYPPDRHDSPDDGSGYMP